MTAIHPSGREDLNPAQQPFGPPPLPTRPAETPRDEVGDEESCYEVEVTLPDGQQTDVQLDEDFKVVSSETYLANDG